MKEHPILFSGPMVRAIIDGTKTQTRRVVKFPKWASVAEGIEVENGIPEAYSQAEGRFSEIKCQHGQTGTKLWVREKFGQLQDEDGGRYVYRADFPPDNDEFHRGKGWKPSIFMPRVASRILLEITDIRCERLQDISEADAISEGIEWCGGDDRLPQGNTNGIDAGWKNYMETGNFDGFFVSPISSFQSLWESINGAESLEQNPLVWVIEFKRITP